MTEAVLIYEHLVDARCVGEATASGTAIPDKTQPEKVRKPMDETKVQRWLNYVKKRRENSSETYSRCILRFEATMNIKADDLLAMPEEERIETLECYLNFLTNLAPKTQSLYIGVLKSFLGFYRKETRLHMKIHGINTTPTLKNERIPDPATVRELINRLPARLAASSVLIGFSGLRFETQVKLKLEDLIDFNVETLQFTRQPALIYVPAEASKNGRQYFTFLIKEGCEVVEAYLRNRRLNGETLTSDSNVITQLNGVPIRAWVLRRYLNKHSKDILKTRPYVLRSYFNTNLLAAGVHPDWKRFFTGHKGDIEETYSTRKQLPDWAIEKMREAFQPAAEQLPTMKLDAKTQQRTAAITTIKILQSQFTDNSDIQKGLEGILRQLQTVK